MIDQLSVDLALMAAGDERSKKASSERDRGLELRKEGEEHKSELAHDYAWTLRNQAAGLWEAAAIVRQMAETAEKDKTDDK